MKSAGLLALAGAASATIQGFNYASTFTTGSAKVQSDFESEFARAQTLQNTSGWNAARLYTMIQGGTTDTPISAIPAAISTKTGLLLGLWASAGQSDFDNELTALSSAISQYGTSFTDLILGISVGSEDLYRITPTGIENDSGAGAEPSTLVSYISQVRSLIADTSASSASVGHVDTWTAWVNGSNSAVIDAVDWLGFDGYPYFQTADSNGIDNGLSLFEASYDATVAAAAGKDVWVTETGWPVSGPDENLAVASVANAKTYWDEVGCGVLFGKVNTFWYTIQDASPTTPSPSFGLIGSDLSSAPIFDLTCSANSSSSSSSVATSSSVAASSSVASATAPGTTAATTTASIVVTPGVESGSLSASSAAFTTVTVTTYLPLESCPATCANTATTLLTSTTAVATTSTKATTSAVSTTTTSTTTSTTAIQSTSTKTSTTSVQTTSTKTSTTSVQTTSTKVATTTSSTTTAVTTSQKSATSSTTTTASTSSSCPTNLDGTYQYPHLIVPVNSASPNTAYGTVYNGTVSSTISTIFNFDIPTSYSGETCSLVFLFPELSQLETSSYTWNSEGGISVSQLSSAATEETTYNTVPSVSNSNFGSVSSLVAGSGYVINTFSCPAGETVSYEFSSTGGDSLNWFNDWNPSPLGTFITVC